MPFYSVLILAMTLVGLAGCAGTPGTEIDSGVRFLPESLTGMIDMAEAVQTSRTEADYPGGYLTALSYQNAGLWAEAADTFRHVLAHDPANKDLIPRIFLLDLSSGRIDRALEIAAQLPDGTPEWNLAVALHIVDNVKRGDLKSARTALADMPRVGFNRQLAILIEAWLDAGEDDHDKALETVEILADEENIVPLYQLHKGLLLDDSGALDAAANWMAPMLENGVSTPILRAVGNILERAGHPSAARIAFERIDKTMPNTPYADAFLERQASGLTPLPVIGGPVEAIAEIYLELSRALRHEDDHDVALLFAQIAAEIRPDSNSAAMLRGEILGERGRFELAANNFLSVSPASPMFFLSRLLAAGPLEQAGKTPEAIAALKTALDSQPDSFPALVALGDLLRRDGRYREAIDLYNRATDALDTPDQIQWTLFYARGIAYEQTGDWPKAEADLKQALVLDPDQPFVLNYLGYSWTDRGEHLDRAREMVVRAVELRPKDGYIVDSLGWVYYRLGQYDKAVETLERAVYLNPRDPTINDHLGDAYWRVDRKREAAFQWNHALTFLEEQEARDRVRRAATLDRAKGTSTRAWLKRQHRVETDKYTDFKRSIEIKLIDGLSENAVP
ncbi:MAG: tetratricopeptide repeat protein [Pseudomonadota bacterium]|nr:tetratricopeptide repeat protein [Pseudomonadota bacterium]